MSSCIALNDSEQKARYNSYAAQFPGETFQTVTNALGIWHEKNPDREEQFPSVQELQSFIKEMRDNDKGTKTEKEEATQALAPSAENNITIKYVPKGKSEQTYTIKGDKIYNKNGKEVFKKDSADRYSIFAKLAVKQGRAVVVNYNGKQYIVNNRNQILSTATRKIMQWGEENDDRKAILDLAKSRFEERTSKTAPSIVNQQNVSNTRDNPFNITKVSEQKREQYSQDTGISIDHIESPNTKDLEDYEFTEIVLVTPDGNRVQFAPKAGYQDLDNVINNKDIKAMLGLNYLLEKYLTEHPEEVNKMGSSVLSEYAKDIYAEDYDLSKDNFKSDYIDYVLSQRAQALEDNLVPPPPAIEDVPITIRQEESIDDSGIESLPIATVAEQRAVDFAFDPTIRRDRVTLISRLFSTELSNALEEAKENIDRRMMEEDLTEEQRDELRNELYSLNRESLIDKLTPAGIFERVRQSFQRYVDDTNEGRVQAEFAKRMKLEQDLVDEGVIDESERYSEEEILESSKKKAAYKYEEYQKILKYFEPLAEEASLTLSGTEGLLISTKYMASEDVSFNEDTPEGQSFLDGEEDSSSSEERVKDGWMTNFRHVSPQESLSQAVRKIIREIPRLDYEGNIDEDDLGNDRYLDADYVHAALIDNLRFMSTSEDMIPLLEKLQTTKPWVEEIIKAIQNDDTLFSQFYQDFRKDYVEYWIQKKKLQPDGSYKIETVSINKPEGVYYLLDSWRDNYESGTLLDKDSVYGKNRELNKDNAKKGLDLFNELNNQFQNTTFEEGIELLNTDEVWGKLMKMFHMIGIEPNTSILRTALENKPEIEGATVTDPIKLLLPNFQVIFKGIQEGKVKSETKEDGTKKLGDLLNTFGSAYNNIASMIAEVSEDAIESSVRENDKSYYSHLTPSYLGKLMKQFQNVMDNEAKFNEFINKEFKQYEWFYKDGKWRNDWIEQLVNNPKMRKAFRHKVVLNYDKQPYQEWDNLTYTQVLLNEYWSERGEGMAWYHLPILSDAPSGEFIRFKRYTTGSEGGAYGNRKTYKDIILEKMLDLVNQEYDRIMLVRERYDAYINGDNIAPLANYDISVNSKTGEIKSKGGSEFKFLPALNNYMEDGELFIDKLTRLKKEGSPSEFETFVKRALETIMEDGFEKAYSEWHDIGLLDELPNGKFKNIPFEGQSKVNAKVVKALRAAREILKEDFTEEMEELLDKYKSNMPVNDRQANRIFDYIKEELDFEVSEGYMTKADADNISRDLNTKNNSKDALREYYYNSEFATSQIIELLTTDLAFYKDMEDFQKRFKEVHAPSLRLNTQATFHGEKVGRTWERTIYLVDDEITSSVAKDIEGIFLDKNKSGEISDLDAATVISKYGLHNVERNGKKYYKVGKVMVETSYVNVADAQAYRSISSYKAIMVMSGQWNDEMELAYKHLTDPNGQWTMEDFNIIWQTKKPYVYTQINNDSGIEGHTGIKTPVQHKNSEFLLLAMHDAVAGPLKKSGKLRALNKFMEKYQIDVSQFESTTKVGKQMPININSEAVKVEQELLKNEGKSYTEEDAVTSILEKATGITNGNENPNVVHKVSYEDYGIQTATPEHAIDHEQLVGTQIRKLIAADIADNATFTIGDKTFTKKEWVNLYNKINTENILQKFIEIDKEFSDPKKVEKLLQDEIRGNQRYGQDMLRACTLDKNGNFNLPLYDPVQSQRIQTLLNSILKSRITKQKISGGSLIQVSAYGLSDDLKIVFEGEGTNKRIKYVDCYMPAYSRKFYEPLMGEDGILHIDDWVDSKGVKHKGLPEELRRLIGYRVPTEDKYSMLPLRIKGFLPQQNGSAIMLPAEITTIAGSDFDKRSMSK